MGEHVQAAEAVTRRLNDRLVRTEVGEVDAERNVAVAVAGGEDIFDSTLVDVDGEHLGPRRGERLRHRLADATRRAGDDDTASLQARTDAPGLSHHPPRHLLPALPKGGCVAIVSNVVSTSFAVNRRAVSFRPAREVRPAPDSPAAASHLTEPSLTIGAWVEQERQPKAPAAASADRRTPS